MGLFTDNEEEILEDENEETLDSFLGVKEKATEDPVGIAGRRGKERSVDPTIDIRLLKKQLSERDAKINELANELKNLRPAAAAVQKMQRVFVGDDDSEIEIAKKREITRRFDEDPAGTLEELLLERERKILSQIEKKDRTRSVKETMAEVEKEYAVDWDKYGKKIQETLNTFDPEYKQNNLKQALVSAIELNRAGKKRKTLPYVEGSNLSPEAIEKRRLTREQEIKKLILKHRGEANPLSGFMNEALGR